MKADGSLRWRLSHLGTAALLAAAPGLANTPATGEGAPTLMASIVGEKQGASVQTLSEEKRQEVRAYLDQVLKEVGPELEIEIRFVSSLNNFRSLAPCRRSGAFVLEMDPRMYEDLRQMGDRALTFVLAHEIGHFLQYLANPELVDKLCRGQQVEARAYELLADFSAGYISNALHAAPVSAAAADFRVLDVLARLADYDFTRVDHHGTTTQRMSANGLGALANQYGKPLDMAKLLSGKRRFEELLFVGSPQPSWEAQQRTYLQSLEELYQ